MLHFFCCQVTKANEKACENTEKNTSNIDFIFEDSLNNITSQKWESENLNNIEKETIKTGAEEQSSDIYVVDQHKVN